MGLRSLVLCMLVAPAVQAAEGMYLLHQLPVQRLQRSGLKIQPDELLRLSRAVVQVASGGTGSFVSPRGLVVTNHHVAYRCIAMLGARKEHLGLLDRGHQARTAGEELPCPGYDMLVVEQVRDVKQQVLSVVKPTMSWSARFEAIRLQRARLAAECEKDGAHICEVAALDGGVGYLLSVYRRIRDVRLVYAPPRSLGKFGGDVDNWIYPRHTADFAFLRAYVSASGSGAPHAVDNVPLATPVHLKLSTRGVRRGALVEVIGFPGRTSRHASAHAVRFYAEDQLPAAITLIDGLIKVLEPKMSASEDIRRKYASLEAGLQNAVKYYQMSQQGLKRWNTLQRKVEAEQALRQSLPPRGQQRMAHLDAEMGKVFRRYRTFHARLLALRRLSSWACPSMRLAHDIVRWGREKARPDTLRKDEPFKDKNIYRLQESSDRLEQEINLEAEQALLLFFLRQDPGLGATRRLLAWSRGEQARRRARAAGRVGVEGGDPLQLAVQMVYDGTRLVAHDDRPESVQRARALRTRLLGMSAAQLQRFDDPLLRLARDVEREHHALREGPYKLVEQYLETVLHPAWVEEILHPAYPDANFTVRLSYGSVADYHASDSGKDFRYLTSLTELLAKDRGTFPFEVPVSLKKAAARRRSSPMWDGLIKDVPVNFTSTLDTTGGNSGSPVLDDHGRLVGLLFDGTPESILSDWQYLQQEQRSICLDIRFALYLAEVDGNRRLLQELGRR